MEPLSRNHPQWKDTLNRTKILDTKIGNETPNTYGLIPRQDDRNTTLEKKIIDTFKIN